MDIFYFLFDKLFRRKKEALLKKKAEEKGVDLSDEPTDSKKEEVKEEKKEKEVSEDNKVEDKKAEEKKDESTASSDDKKSEDKPAEKKESSGAGSGVINAADAKEVADIKSEITKFKNDITQRITEFDERISKMSKALGNVQGPPEGFTEKLKDMEEEMEKFRLQFYELSTNSFNPFIENEKDKKAMVDSMNEYERVIPKKKNSPKSFEPPQEEPEAPLEVVEPEKKHAIEEKKERKVAPVKEDSGVAEHEQELSPASQKEIHEAIQSLKTQEDKKQSESSDAIQEKSVDDLNKMLEHKLGDLLTKKKTADNQPDRKIEEMISKEIETQALEQPEKSESGVRDTIQLYDQISDQIESVDIEAQVPPPPTEDKEDYDEIEQERISIIPEGETEEYKDEKIIVEHSIQMPENESKIRKLAEKIILQERVDKTDSPRVEEAQIEKIEDSILRDVMEKLRSIKDSKPKTMDPAPAPKTKDALDHKNEKPLKDEANKEVVHKKKSVSKKSMEPPPTPEILKDKEKRKPKHHKKKYVKKSKEQEKQEHTVKSKHTYAPISADQYFRLSNGGLIRNLNELVFVVDNIDDETFKEHVNESRNDFYNWIVGVFNDDALGTKIRAIKDRQAFHKALEEYLF